MVAAPKVGDALEHLSELAPADSDALARRAAAFTKPDATGTRQLADLAITLCDLTSLEATDTPASIATLARRAARREGGRPPVAAVCVHTDLVDAAVAALGEQARSAGGPVAVAAACGAFPHGRASLTVKLADVADAISRGADELDVVIDRGAVIAGHHRRTAEELAAICAAADGRLVKVIIETGELNTPTHIQTATWIALSAGADQVKTSTGKSAVGATVEAAIVICDTVSLFNGMFSQARGVKISGGVRTASDAFTYLNVAADILGPDSLTPARFRLGASSLLDDLENHRTR
jgi:deoxyribose-phosphate aldolase